MGTPAVVYDVDGLRDAAKHGNGFVVRPHYTDLAKQLVSLNELIQHSPQEYLALRENTLSSAKQITFEQCAKDFETILKN
jgi:glycosyltransferase involved in cell wall biosynthesis